MPYLTNFYNQSAEDERFSPQHGQVEFLTTMRYVEKYLTPGSKIIEIGAGTGRYSHTLARRGYVVDAVELVQSNIDVFRAHTQPTEAITVVQGNALDLSAFADNSYDITLVLGPLYHLFTAEDKRQALQEAIRIAKSNGIVFVAYCLSDASIINYGFKKGHIFELIEKGMLEIEHFKAFSHPWDIFELHHQEDIDALMVDFPVTRLHFVASDGFTKHMQETVDAMDESTFSLYLKYHFTICERADMVGLSHHVLDIFRKTNPNPL